jgi:hypothetical protein
MMGLFRKAKDSAAWRQNGDVATVREKLATVEAEITQAGAELDRLALHAVLAGDSSATEATARLEALRQRRDLLTRALSAAELADRTSREALNAQEHLARKRALAQHASALKRHTAEIATALRQLHDAQARMTASGASITALLPPSMFSSGQPWDKLFGAEELRQMTLLEGHRQGRENGTLLFHRPPWARALERDDGSLPALSERISNLAETVRARFDQSLPSVEIQQRTAASGDQPQPVSSSPASSASVAPVVLPPSAAAGSETRASSLTGVHVDLRSNAGERFTDLTERVAWPEAEPVTEAADEPTPQAEPAELTYFKD